MSGGSTPVHRRVYLPTTVPRHLPRGRKGPTEPTPDPDIGGVRGSRHRLRRMNREHVFVTGSCVKEELSTVFLRILLHTGTTSSTRWGNRISSSSDSLPSCNQGQVGPSSCTGTSEPQLGILQQSSVDGNRRSLEPEPRTINK